MAAESTFWKTNLQGTIELRDGTGTPVTLTIGTDRGDLKITGLGAKLNAPQVMTRRGRFGSLNRGERVFPQVTFSCFMGNAVGSTTSAPGTPSEFLSKLGAYAANVSTLGANREYTVDIRLTIEGTNFGDSSDETITCEDCVATVEIAEGIDGNVLTISAQCLGSVVFVNGTNTVTMAQAA